MIHSQKDHGIHDVKGLRQHRDTLLTEKSKLATELKKVQNLLKIKVDTDQQNTALLKTQMEQINQALKNNAIKTGEIELLVKKRNEELIKLKNLYGPQGLSES